MLVLVLLLVLLFADVCCWLLLLVLLSLLLLFVVGVVCKLCCGLVVSCVVGFRRKGQQFKYFEKNLKNGSPVCSGFFGG